MFFVVFSGNWCSTVPESWINRDEETIAWPNKKENATIACKKGTNPKAEWTSTRFTKLLGPYETYDIARAVEIAAVDVSTSDEKSFQSGFDKEQVSKRPRKKPARFVQSSPSSAKSSSTDDEDESRITNISNKQSKQAFNYVVHGEIDNTNTEVHDNLDTQPLDYGTFFLDTLNPALEEQTDHMKQIDNTAEKQSTGTMCQHCCPACRLKLDTILRKLDLLLMDTPTNTRQHLDTIPNMLPDFPITSHEDLLQFNQLLINSNDARTQYEKLITLRACPDGKKNIREVLGHILTDELCCKLSWSGQKKTIKVEDMIFVQLLRNTITTLNDRCTLPETKQAIMSWLQHGSDRVRAVAEKHNK